VSDPTPPPVEHVASPALFPPFVVQRSVRFEVGGGGDLAAAFPGVLLPEWLGKAVPKRQTEFLAGRYCAREALRIAAPEHAERPIGRGTMNEPAWPPRIVGAITHTDRFASVAIATTEHAHALGLDVERWVSDEQATSLLEQIATPDEIAALRRATGWSVGKVFTIVFSAKETIFKCLFPEVRRYFDFREARVTALTPDGSFRAELLVPLTPSLPAGHRLEGRFVEDAATVATGMLVPA
jgi:enterobactin synthetase component D